MRFCYAAQPFERAAEHPTGLENSSSGPAVTPGESRMQGTKQTTPIWGCSSVGRAPDLHSGGRQFDPDQLHQINAFTTGL